MKKLSRNEMKNVKGGEEMLEPAGGGGNNLMVCSCGGTMETVVCSYSGWSSGIACAASATQFCISHGYSSVSCI